MIVELHDYHIGTGSGDATVLVLQDDNVVFDGTVNFEFTVDKYETGDGYLTPIEWWTDVEVTDMEFFDLDNHRVEVAYEVKQNIEYELIEKIKDKEYEN